MLYSIYEFSGTGCGDLSRSYFASGAVPFLSGVVSTFVALVYGFVLLPTLWLGVKYSPLSIFSSSLIAVINLVNAKSTFFFFTSTAS